MWSAALIIPILFCEKIAFVVVANKIFKARAEGLQRSAGLSQTGGEIKQAGNSPGNRARKAKSPH